MGATLGITAGQAAINTASGIVGQTIGRIFGPRDRQNQLEQQDKLNEQAYDINNRMAEANYEREMRKWEDTNYSAQVEQLNKAGLNPGLLYGMSGGGGATASAAPGQGVGAGQAESSRQGMAIQPVSLMQLEIMKAQKENIEADTANKLSENPNIAHTGKNIQADTALKEANTAITKLEGIFKNATLEQGIANFAEEATIIRNNARQSINQADITSATKDDVIKKVNAELLNTLMNTNEIKQAIKESASRIHKTDQEIQSIIQKRYTDMEELFLKQSQLSEEQRHNLFNRINDQIEAETGLGKDILKALAQGLGLATMIKSGGTPRPEPIGGFKTKY